MPKHQSWVLIGTLSVAIWWSHQCSRVTLSRQCMYLPCQRGYLWWTGNVLACQARGSGFDSACRRSQPLLQWRPKWDHQRAVMSVHVWNSGRKWAASFVQVLYCSHIWEQGGWERLLDESDSCLSKGTGERNWESSWCGLSMLYSNCVVVRTLTVLTVPGVRGRTLIWQGRKCSRVTLSRQYMYWPCQRGYLFGELVTYFPAKREVPGSTRPAGAVSHCYFGSSHCHIKYTQPAQDGRVRGNYITK